MSTRSPQDPAAGVEPSGDEPRDGAAHEAETGAAQPPETAEETAGRTRRRRRRRVLGAVLVFVLLVVLGAGGLLWQRQASYNGNIDRLPGTMPTGPRPGPNVVGTENWLLVGSDTRVEAHTTGEGGQLWKPGQQRSDTLMLLHLPAERDKAYVISIPRDSWVP